MPKEVFLVARGKIGGTWASGFHKILPDGRPICLTTYSSREFYKGEREEVLSDILRHKQKLLSELAELDKAELAIRMHPHRERGSL